MGSRQQLGHVRTAAPRSTKSARLHKQDLTQGPAPPERRFSYRITQKNWMVNMEGYCLKDKKKVEMKDPHPITMKNGKPATVGTCPICGTKIYRIGKST